MAHSHRDLDWASVTHRDLQPYIDEGLRQQRAAVRNGIAAVFSAGYRKARTIGRDAARVVRTRFGHPSDARATLDSPAGGVTEGRHG